MTYQEALAALEAGHAVVRRSWKMPEVCIKSFSPGSKTWLDGHHVVPWSPSDECEKANDWILADDVYEEDTKTRQATVARLKAIMGR